jgi:alkanesulfonate monooxygenase SsuD/methylene tetrahydromethanopterin reductase-like flavin-dependent oxidoreductase (luciferase family)
MSAVKLASPVAQRMSAIKASSPAARPGRPAAQAAAAASASASARESDGALAAAADRLKRKYAETDPLNEFLGGNEDVEESGEESEEWQAERPAVKARVSREPLLSAKPPAAPR